MSGAQIERLANELDGMLGENKGAVRKRLLVRAVRILGRCGLEMGEGGWIAADLADLRESGPRYRICRRCGCTEWDGCGEGCSWVESDLCSACAPRPRRTRNRLKAELRTGKVVTS